MNKSIRKQAKRLRRKAKPHDQHSQSPGYWKKEMQRRDASWIYGGDLANPAMYKQ